MSHLYCRSRIIQKQEGNSNLDSLPRTAVAPMTQWGGGGSVISQLLQGGVGGGVFIGGRSFDTPIPHPPTPTCESIFFPPHFFNLSPLPQVVKGKKYKGKARLKRFLRSLPPVKRWKDRHDKIIYPMRAVKAAM